MRIKIKSSFIGTAIFLLILLTILVLTGCGQQVESTVNENDQVTYVCNQKMTQVEMGNTGYWIVTRPWKEGDVAETHTLFNRWGSTHTIVELQTADGVPRVVWP